MYSNFRNALAIAWRSGINPPHYAIVQLVTILRLRDIFSHDNRPMNSTLRKVCIMLFWCSVTNVTFTLGVESSKILDDVVSHHAEFQKSFRPSVIAIDVVRKDNPAANERRISVQLKQMDDLHKLASIHVDEMSELYVRNPSYYFNIERKASGHWTVKNIERLSTHERPPYLTLDVLEADLIYPVIINDLITVTDLINMSGVKALQLSDAVEDGIRVVSLELVLPETRKRSNGTDIDFERVRLSFIPEKYSWIPTDIELIYPDRATRKIRRSDFINIGQFSIPLSSAWHMEYPNGRRGESCQISYLPDDSATVEKKVFFLSHYGLPEPDFGERRANRFRYTLMVFGGLMVVFALWQMYQKRKEEKA